MKYVIKKLKNAAHPKFSFLTWQVSEFPDNDTRSAFFSDTSI